MKKSLLAIAMLFLSSGLFAQEGKLDLSVGYGIGSTPQALSIFGAVSFYVFDAALNKDAELRADETSYTGAIVVGGKYGLSDRMRLGADFVFDKIEFKNKSLAAKVFSGTYISVVPRFDYTWSKGELFNFYSGVGLGLTFISADKSYNTKPKNDVLLAYNVVPVGMEVGHKLKFYAELNAVGANGAFSGGLRYSF